MKNHYLSIDVGTTCLKCQCFSSDGTIIFYKSLEYPTLYIDNSYYADIVKIKEYVFKLILEANNKCDISSICFSSFGESFVLLDKDDNIIHYPLLYSDPKGNKEALFVKTLISDEEMYFKTGTIPQGMFSIYKLLYIKEEKPEIYTKINKLLLIVDYLNYILTGKAVIDYSLAARTGILNINTLQYDQDIATKLGIDLNIFSKISPTGSIVGKVKDEIKSKLGLLHDVVIILGSHDQVCNALGCGCYKNKDASDGMGTVECITPIFNTIPPNVEMGKKGIPIVPFLKKNLYCTYLCNYACNSITNWLKNEINHDYHHLSTDYFKYMEEHCVDELSDIFVLPYFSGNCVPYQDTTIKGSIIGLTTHTKDYQIYQAVVESLNYEMRFEISVAKEYGININNIVATGGGSKSKFRLQHKADVLGIPIKTLRSSEGGLCGAAILQAVALKDYPSLKDAIKAFVIYNDSYQPRNLKNDKIEEKYQNYIKLYHLLKDIH